MPRMGAPQRQPRITTTTHLSYSLFQYALRYERSGQGMRASHRVSVMMDGDTASHSNLSWRCAQSRQAISVRSLSPSDDTVTPVLKRQSTGLHLLAHITASAGISRSQYIHTNSLASRPQAKEKRNVDFGLLPSDKNAKPVLVVHHAHSRTHRARGSARHTELTYDGRADNPDTIAAVMRRCARETTH
jgi:hypothetical protein